MDDRQIVELFLQRSETAIAKTAEKYGAYCRCIANRILENDQDSEECVNDAFLRAWNAIPPQEPENLAAFLGKITRNLALDRYKYNRREKRGSGQVVLALEELDACIPAGTDPEQVMTERQLAAAFNGFLASQPERKRKIFVRRYWYFSTVREIAEDFGISESNVKVILLRTRRELKRYLEKEGIAL